MYCRLFYRWYSALLAVKESAAGAEDPMGVSTRPKSSSSRIRGGNSSSDEQLESIVNSSSSSSSRKSIFAVKEAILLEGGPTSPMKGNVCMYV